MIEFLKEASSLYWWLSVVLVGLAIAIAGHFLGKGLEKAFSKLSKKWSRRIDEKNKRRSRLVGALVTDHLSLIDYRVTSIQNQILALITFLASFALNVIHYTTWKWSSSFLGMLLDDSGRFTLFQTEIYETYFHIFALGGSYFCLIWGFLLLKRGISQFEEVSEAKKRLHKLGYAEDILEK